MFINEEVPNFSTKSSFADDPSKSFASWQILENIFQKHCTKNKAMQTTVDMCSHYSQLWSEYYYYQKLQNLILTASNKHSKAEIKTNAEIKPANFPKWFYAITTQVAKR